MKLFVRFMKRKNPHVTILSAKRLPYLRFAAIAFVLLLAGCSTADSGRPDLFRYKDSYVGDNSAVGNIVGRLPGNEDFQKMELKTAEEPYGIILHYAPNEELTGKEVGERFLYNASFLFALVKNADWIEFVYGEQSFKVSREALQNRFGTDLRDFSAEEELDAFLRERLKTVEHPFFN